MSFTRTIEDFTCEHCGKETTGNGYTNHCPHCLWSKHVDVQPGDRAATCGGMMEPRTLEGSSPDYNLVHVCTTCGISRKNRISASDDSTAVLSIAHKAGSN